MKRTAAITALILAALAIAAGVVLAEGTVTTTETKRSMRVTSIDWQAGTNGAGFATATVYLSGQIERVVYVPDSGATTPSNAYDVTLTDQDGLDVLRGGGANLASNATAQAWSGSTTNLPLAVDGAHTFTATNTAASKGGVVRLYWR